jgi:uncharacterized protein YodC (DUF2158 family)
MEGEINQIKVDGIVQLKSGGPDMTVEWVGLDDKGRERALCSRFSDKGGEMAYQFFGTACLVAT